VVGTRVKQPTKTRLKAFDGGPLVKLTSYFLINLDQNFVLTYLMMMGVMSSGEELSSNS